jgi:hypothetical protein
MDSSAPDAAADVTVIPDGGTADGSHVDAANIWDGGDVFFCECHYDQAIQSICHGALDPDVDANTFGGELTNTSQCAPNQAKLWCIRDKDAGYIQTDPVKHPCSHQSITTIPTTSVLIVEWACCDL